MSAQISLEPVDAVYVTVLVDNFVDILLPSGEVAQRPRVAWDMLEREGGATDRRARPLAAADRRAGRPQRVARLRRGA
jgi:hypothetical protein